MSDEEIIASAEEAAPAAVAQNATIIAMDEKMQIRTIRGSDASNTDPHATEAAQAGEWVDTGPHVIEFRFQLSSQPSSH